MNIDPPHTTLAAQSSAFATLDPVQTAVDHQINLVFDYFKHRCPGLLIKNPGLSIGEPMNPLLTGTTFAVAYTFLSGLTVALNRPNQAEDLKFLFSCLLPIFSVIQNYSQGALFNANIQSVGCHNKIHPETDFVFMEKQHCDAHIADTKSKSTTYPSACLTVIQPQRKFDKKKYNSQKPLAVCFILLSMIDPLHHLPFTQQFHCPSTLPQILSTWYSILRELPS